MKLLKAGTYIFASELTEVEFSQNINLSATATDGGITGVIYISAIAGIKYDYFGLIVTIDSMIVDGEEQVEEPTLMGVYSSSDKIWDLPIRIHTITEDTVVDDTFADWYLDNTDYYFVNGEEEPLPLPDDTEQPEEPEPEAPKKKFTRLYLGEVAYSSNGKRFRKLQTEEYVEPSLRFESNGDGTCYVTGLGSYASPNIVIPSVSPDGDTVTGIDDYSLMSYQTIESVTIPNTITFIGTEAFYSCESLKSVVIGSGVTRIRSKAFFGCSLLNNITFNGTVEQWNAISLGISWNYYVPAEFVQCTNGRVWLGEKISDLRNTTWHLASGWTAPKGYGVFSVRVQVTRSNSEVLISNGIAVGFEYQNDINNIPSVGNVIYLPTGSINIYSNEAIDVYFVDSGYDTDITNTDLIDWLYTCGELKTETL